MDFPDPYSFTGQQYQGMMQIPPLTPSHSHSAPSEEFTSSPDNFQMSGDQMATFDYMQQGSAFPGPPTPPNAAFNNKFQQQQQQQPGQDGDDAVNRGGSEEDDSMTPAQSRRKAQNRAAQRAFRERKERHVKDLEAKLATLEAAQAQASEENERLKRDLAKVSTENEILRATSAMNAASGNSGTAAEDSSPATTGPMQYQPTDFYSTLLKDHTNKTPSHRVVTGDDGERLFAAGATWDYILGHDLYKRGLVNIEQVSERLKYQAKCDGQGPVFAERDIVAAIEQSVASGSDDLL